MARTKKEKEIVKDSSVPSNAYIANGGIVVEQSITDTLETNYMPYAMSVIVSRALPEIDGFKPAHRKLLYTMYKMGLLGSTRMKSANVVGQTMRLNPHGDASIYETLVRMSRGYEALLHPFVDSKGNFGKAYSRDMAYAASRYTEVKLEPIANELFRDIDKDAVDFVPNYDNTMLEPTLLPAVFPTILVNANVGIAVSMASSICSFNLGEVCEATIALIRDEEADISGIIKGPDFSGGGLIIHDQAELEKIFRTGRGSVKVRAKYSLDKENGCIDVTEIPPTTTIEAIMDKIVELVKGGKIREISYIRDEIDKNGLKLCIDIKRGTDPDKLMQKLYKMTPLEDTYSCNFNVLVGGTPKVMGVYEIISEWVAFRLECVKRRIYFDLTKKKDKLHLLKGLNKILLDIDKAIKIVRETEEEAEVVPNLMIGFGLDQTQAEYVAEIKLRHLNREYILKRTAEIEELTKAIADMEDTLSSNRKVKQIIISELQDIIKKYPQPRKSLLMSQDVAEIEEEEQEQVPDYPVNIFVTKEGYFKKITPQSLRMSSEHKLKDGDEIVIHTETTNACELLFFTDKQQVYKSRANDFDDTKASAMGEYVAAKLGFDENEKLVGTVILTEYKGHLIFAFENGKIAKVPVKSYETKTNRKRLTNAYSDKSPLVDIVYETEPTEYVLTSSNTRMLIFNSAVISEKTTRDTIGVNVMTQKKNQVVVSIKPLESLELASQHRYRTKTLPSIGAIVKEEDLGEQIHF